MEHYLGATADCKIAFYMVNHWPEPGEGPQDHWLQREADRLRHLHAASDLVLVIDEEIAPGGLVDQPDLRALDRLYWIIPAAVRGLESRVISWQYHVWRICELYKNQIGHQLLRLEPWSIKPYCFDALLGMRKPHRQLVHDLIYQHYLQSKILHSMGPDPGQLLDSSMWTDPNFFIDPSWEISPGCDYRSLNQSIWIDGCCVQMPNALPIQVYNQSAYSIICETWHSNSAIMATEKLAKAVIGRRLFVVFAGAGYLRFLRSEGFKTFGDVIDESYDDIEDDRQRWHAAFEQVRELCAMDQAQVLARIRLTVDHNYLHAMNRDLEQPPFDKITRLILDHVG